MFSKTRGAKLGAIGAGGRISAENDLEIVAEAWPTLPEAIRIGILAMVRAAAS